MLLSYEDAVRKMLALPVTDPRNWYRIAFTHFLDCPHGNWWILPWHRGFTGFVEQMVREVGGDPNFAFPYWDWTDEPAVPASMNGGALNPNNFAGMYPTPQAFHDAFDAALVAAGYWSDPGQLQQLGYRGMPTPDDMWQQIFLPPDGPAFYQPPNARSPAAALDCVAGAAVTTPVIDIALSPQNFITFGSNPAQHHSQVAGFGILELQPHNKIHNNVGGLIYPGTIGNCDRYDPTDSGGYMQNNLSPVDPLFFLHHSNLDRLWQVWTDNQTAHQLPTLPVGADYQQWASEPFLFFFDGAGRPVTQNQAGYYSDTARFDYDYRPGAMQAVQLMRTPGRRSRARRPVNYYAAEVPAGLLGATALSARTTPSAVRLVRALVQEARSADRVVMAKILTTLPPHHRGQLFRVVVHGDDPDRSVEVGTLSMFGHVTHHGPTSFTLPAGAAIARLVGSGGARVGGLLHFRVLAPPGAGHGLHAEAAEPSDLRILSVQLEAH